MYLKKIQELENEKQGLIQNQKELLEIKTLIFQKELENEKNSGYD
jgi:hypothetical protein